MARVVMLKPYLETDATWEMIRTSTYLGLWYMASKLKNKGHDVWYLDEVVRNSGMKRTKLFNTILKGNEYIEEPIDIDLYSYRQEKNRFFHDHEPSEFIAKYSAFRDEGEIKRVLAKTGNMIDETIERIRQIKPDYVCIALIATANYRSATKTGKRIKEEFPDIKIIYGGHHVSALPYEFLQENPWIDHIIIGDGIEIIDQIVEGKVEDKIIYEGFKGLENFPLLDMEIIRDTGYPLDQEYSYPSFGRKSTDFMFSKGCFRKCDFCVAGGQKGNHVTVMDWDMVDEQFKIFKEEGIEEIIVQDDAFIYKGNEMLKRKLELLKKYDFFWQDSGGIDFELLDDDVTDLLIDYNNSKTGRLTGLYIPFNPRYWNKNVAATKSMVGKYNRNFENLRRLKESGIYVFTSQIVGTPECTREIIEEDINIHREMIKSGYLDTALTLSATLLPGTKWYEAHSNLIVNKKDILGYSLFTTHHRTEKMNDPRLIEEMVVYRTRELNKIQKTYNWQTAFPNSIWDYKN